MLQICVPMSVEFEELAKLRENPAEDFTSKCFCFLVMLGMFPEHNKRYTFF